MFTMDKKKLIQASLTGLIATAGVVGLSATDAKAKPKWEGHEKCYGVAEAGQNDCGNAEHSCSGMAEKDREADEWIYVPKGLCDKIAGGSLEPKEKKK